MDCTFTRSRPATRGNEYLCLLLETRSGREDSMGELAVLVQKRLYSFLLRITMDHHLAEDALQETLLSMVQKLTSLQRMESFWPWIHHVAWSKIQQQFRERMHQLSLEVSMRQQYRQDEQQTINKDVLESVAHKESIEGLFVAIRQMECRSRETFYLRCFHQLPYGEIAALVQSTPNEVRVRFCRAKKFLRDRMTASCA